MNFLFIGDPHIKNDNNEETDILINEIERIYKIQNFDYIVVGGDIMHYHERLFTQALNKSLEFLKRLSKLCFVYVLVGNHDMINNQQFLTTNHWMNALKTWENIKIVDEVVEEKEYMLCPYVFCGRFIEALETKTKDWREKKVIFAHQEFKGCKMGAIESIDGDEWDEKYPFVISGHIHDNQRVGKNIYYPGAPLQHAFGDTETRVLCGVDISNDTKITDYDLNVPKKQIIKTDIKNISNIIDVVKKGKNGQKIKLKIDGTSEEFKIFKETSDYKKIIESGVKIQLQKKKEKIDTSSREDCDDFMKILEDSVKNDEELVKKLFDEIVLNKIFIDIL